MSGEEASSWWFIEAGHTPPSPRSSRLCSPGWSLASRFLSATHSEWEGSLFNSQWARAEGRGKEAEAEEKEKEKEKEEAVAA